MAEAAAEQTTYFINPQELEPIQLPQIIEVSELPQNELLVHRANKFISFVGNTAVSREVNVEERHPTSLMEGIQAAAQGHEPSLRLVKANVSTDVWERTMKAGLIITTELTVDGEDKVFQHGQSMDSVQENTLRYAADSWQMRQRAEAETRNSFRIEGLNRQGLLDNYYFVVISRTADNMTKDQLEEAGFFTDTMSTAIQITTATEDGLITESAFVAGVAKPGEALQDEQAVVEIGNSLGIDYSDKTAAEIIDAPLLIHKSLLPNGVVDLVKLYDDCAGGTFFGEAKLKQDYIKYKEVSIQRQSTYAPKIQEIMGQLIARANQIKTPIDAVKLLDKLADGAMVEQSIYDETINPLVFGRSAAPFIEQARYHNEQGNFELARAATKKAKEVSTSSSCPSLLKALDKFATAEMDIDPDISETWHGGKKYHNTKCNSCKKIKSEVGACHICEDCVKNPSKMQKAYDKEQASSQDLEEKPSLVDRLLLNMQKDEAKKAESETEFVEEVEQIAA